MLIPFVLQDSIWCLSQRGKPKAGRESGPDALVSPSSVEYPGLTTDTSRKSPYGESSAELQASIPKGVCLLPSCDVSLLLGSQSSGSPLHKEERCWVQPVKSQKADTSEVGEGEGEQVCSLELGCSLLLSVLGGVQHLIFPASAPHSVTRANASNIN